MYTRPTKSTADGYVMCFNWTCQTAGNEKIRSYRLNPFGSLISEIRQLNLITATYAKTTQRVENWYGASFVPRPRLLAYNSLCVPPYHPLPISKPNIANLRGNVKPKIRKLFLLFGWSRLSLNMLMHTLWIGCKLMCWPISDFAPSDVFFAVAQVRTTNPEDMI